MHPAIFFGNIWPGKIAGPTLLRGQLSSLKRQLSAAVWGCALGRTFQSWRVWETHLKKLPLIVAVPFFYLPTKNCLGDVCEHQSDSWLLKTREFNLEYILHKDRFAFSSSEFRDVDHSWRISIFGPLFAKVKNLDHLQLVDVFKAQVSNGSGGPESKLSRLNTYCF